MFKEMRHFECFSHTVILQRLTNRILQELTEPTVIEQGAYILIAAGAFIFIISFLGYCGAIKESRVLLTAYGLFIIIIAVLQVAAIVLATFYIPQAEEKTKDFFQHTIRKYYTTKDRRDAVTLSWDFMQAEVNISLRLSKLHRYQFQPCFCSSNVVEWTLIWISAKRQSLSNTTEKPIMDK